MVEEVYLLSGCPAKQGNGETRGREECKSNEKEQGVLSQRRKERKGKRQHDERQEVSRIARITRMEAWGKLVDCTKQLESGISGIRGIRVIRD